jgi:hypothetical protein
MSVKGLKLAACLLNISEAQNYAKVEQIARAAISRIQNEDSTFNGTGMEVDRTVLNIFADQIYNRSVITIAGKEIFNAKDNYKNRKHPKDKLIFNLFCGFLIFFFSY